MDITLKSPYHRDLMAQFERQFSGRMDKESKDLWPKGRIYQNGEVNELFLAFRQGAAYGVSVASDSPGNPQPV